MAKAENIRIGGYAKSMGARGHGRCQHCNRGDDSEGEVLKRVSKSGKPCSYCLPFKTKTGKVVRLACQSEVCDVSAQEITKRDFGVDIR